MIEANPGIPTALIFLCIVFTFSIGFSFIVIIRKLDSVLHMISIVVFVLFGALCHATLVSDIHYIKTIKIFYPEDVTYLKDEFEIIIKYDGNNKKSVTSRKEYKLVSDSTFIIKRIEDYNFFDNPLKSYDKVYFPDDKEYNSEKSIPIEL